MIGDGNQFSEKIMREENIGKTATPAERIGL
jgi:hypothetical protein